MPEERPRSAATLPDDRTDVRVVYISGAPRSGTTILGMILGQLEGCTDVGELWALWRPALQNRDLCGCGLPVDECPFWTTVIRDAMGPDFAARGPQLGHLHRRTMGTMRAPLVWAHRRGWRRRAEYDAYAAALGAHYRAIALASGNRIVVDSSKMASDALVATTIPGVEVSLVHIVRDPRGVAWSWKKQRRQPGAQGRPLDRHGLVAAASRWMTYNTYAELLLAPGLGARFRRIRYEDLVRDPEETTRALAQWIGVGESPIPVSGHPPELHMGLETHPVWGNPARTGSGDIALRTDDEWRSGMRWAERLAVTVLTFPFLAWYRFRLGPARTSDDGRWVSSLLG